MPLESTAVEVAVVFGLILANGFLAMAELAIVSARKARLTQLAAKGHSGADLALKLAAAPADFLASIQIAITALGVGLGVFGGARVAASFGTLFASVSVLEPYAELLGLAAVVVSITFLSLIVGELVPKRLALSHAEHLASVLARPVAFLAWLVRPGVCLLGFFTEAAVRLFGIKASLEPSVTEEEVKTLIEQGAAAGVFEREEETMVKRVLRLGDLRAGGLMTPRPKMVFLDDADDALVKLEKMRLTPHSYYPMFRDTQDHVLGFVSTKRVLALLAARRSCDEAIDFASALVDPLYVAESMRALDLLASFKRGGKQLAIVVDEYGGTAGLVSLTDVLEAIAGDLSSGPETSTHGIHSRADGSMLIDGALAYGELLDALRLADDGADTDVGFQSIGGLVMAILARIPAVGDHVFWRGFRLEVVDMDGRRVDKVLVERLLPQPEA